MLGINLGPESLVLSLENIEIGVSDIEGAKISNGGFGEGTFRGEASLMSVSTSSRGAATY